MSTPLEGRPFRHLCPEADMRDAMTDDEFWAHVYPSAEESDDWPDMDASLDAPACPVCDAEGACGYDAEGRALIHATDDEEIPE